MATYYEIPLSGSPETFSIILKETTYQLTTRYVAADMGGWLLDIADADGNPMANGLPLVTGSDLLAQYAYLGIGVALYVATDGDPDAVPTFDNLGTTSHLYTKV